jgi:hypothetical protein
VSLRCHTVNGTHIPGCMGCAAMGDHAYCTCEPIRRKDVVELLIKRVGALEQQMEIAMGAILKLQGVPRAAAQEGDK